MLKKFISIILFSHLMICCSIAHAFGEEDLLPVQLQGKWGYVNNQMEEVIPVQWDFESYFRACETDKVGVKQSDGSLLFGLIDVSGNYLVPCEYIILEGEGETYFGGEDGYYLIMNAQKTMCGYYDIQNHYFCEPIYDDVDVWHKNDENIITVGKSGEDGRVYIHAITGKQIGTEYYIVTYPWHKDTAICMSFDGSWWLQSGNGTRRRIGQGYDVRSDISHGLFIVTNPDGEYSLMNIQADIVADWYDNIELTPMGTFYGESAQYSGIIYCQIGN